MANRSPRLNLTNTSTAMQPLQSKNVQVQRRWPTLPCKSSKERPRLSQATRFTVSAPAVQKCSSTEEVAYTSLQIFQGETKIESSDKIHCVSPCSPKMFKYRGGGLHFPANLPRRDQD